MKTDLEQIFEIESGHGASEELLRQSRVLCYKARTIRCGKQVVEVECYPVYTRAMPDRRIFGERLRSSRHQQELNARRAETRFRRKLETNFGPGDLVLTLTYAQAVSGRERAMKDFRNFIIRVNRRRKSRGMGSVRYMGVMELGRISGRIHFHLIIDGDMGRDEYESVWKKGKAQTERLGSDTEVYARLARYLTKEARDGKQRLLNERAYFCSKGLKEPRVTESVHLVSKRRAARIAEDAEQSGPQIFAKLFPHHQLTELTARRSDYVAGAYIFARLRRNS
jgi:hypothetical protein